jgi:hypothetical protein
MKQTISVFLLVFVLLGVAQAQETKYISGGIARELALGGNPGNSSMMDYTDVYLNPAWAIKYGDFVYSELGYNFAGYSASGQTIGFTYAVTSGLAVGLSVGRQEGPFFAVNSYGPQFTGTVNGHALNVDNSDYFLGGFNAVLTSAGYTAISSANLRPLQAYAAMKLAALTVGASIYRVSWSATNDYSAAPTDPVNTKEEVSAGQTGIKLGALLDMDVMLLDVSALLRINSATAKYTPPPVTPPALSNNQEIDATGTELALNARLFMKLSDKFTLVPMARFSTFGYEPEGKEAVAPGFKLLGKPVKYGRTEFEAGVGANITIPGGHVFAGLSLESISLKREVTTFIATPAASVAQDTSKTQTTKYTASVLSLPKINVGAEFDIASWLTGRLGYFKSFASRTMSYEPPGGLRKEETSGTFDYAYCPPYNLATSAQQLLSVGLGIHFDRLSFDGYLCEQWLSNGPYIVSGVGTAMFGVISMSYSFH